MRSIKTNLKIILLLFIMDEKWTVVSYEKKPMKKKLKIPGYTISSSTGKNNYIKEQNKPQPALKKTIEDTDKPIRKFDKLGKDISSARTIKNLTQKELAQKLNLPANLIQNIENGTAIYDGNIYGKIKNLLELN